MSKTIYRKTKWQIFTRVFSWFLSFSITLTFVLGFASFSNQDVPIAKATTLTSVYAEAAVASTTTSTSTYSTKLAGSGFTSGNTYFIYVTLGLTHSSATGRVNYQIVYDSTVLYTGDIEPAEATANYYTQVDWMDVYTPASTSSLYVKFKGVSIGTTTAANAVIMGLDLTTNEVIENYDYYFGENTTLATHTSSGYADKASITLNNADGVKDWLVFGSEHIAVDSAILNHTARFNYASSYSMERSMEGEDTADDYSFVIYRAYDNIPRGTTIAMQVGDDSTGTNDHILSRIFALNLQVFRDRMTFYSGSDVALTAIFTDLYDSGDLGVDDYTASSTDSHIFFSSYINNVALANG